VCLVLLIGNLISKGFELEWIRHMNLIEGLLRLDGSGVRVVLWYPEVLNHVSGGPKENPGWFLKGFIMESWFNPLRGLPFGHLCCLILWVAWGLYRSLYPVETTT
jgi:hypothetical protein